LQRLRVRLLGLLPGCRRNVLRHARSIRYFSKDLPCRCGLGNLAQRSGRREVPEKRDCGKFAARRSFRRHVTKIGTFRELRTVPNGGGLTIISCKPCCRAWRAVKCVATRSDKICETEMRMIWSLLSIMLGILAALTAKALPTSNSLVITHATIIDVRNGQLLRDQTIVITGDRITSISDQPIEIPARAEVVNVAVPRVS
jgi:hypothetical protein